jgi:large subunit ribosomal protein L28
MSRLCPVSNRRVMFGKNVSHANNRTNRSFEVNVQAFSFFSEVLGAKVSLRLSVRGMRTVEKAGGLDAYLARTPKGRLSAELWPLKRSFEKAQKRVSHKKAA